MTNKERILSTLLHAELCDDCLSSASGVKPRQTVYSICKDLFAEKSVFRHNGMCDHCHKAKLVSRLIEIHESQVHTATTEAQGRKSPRPGHDAWYWEGNIQSQVVSYLVYNGYSILNVANTASREAGKDIIAVTPDKQELWVSVKGYPEKSSNVQARQWFSGALFGLVLYRGEDPSVNLALALPEGFVTYTNLLPRVNWLKQTMPFQVFWISENGSVRVE